jgi:chromosome segregation ATPase
MKDLKKITIQTVPNGYSLTIGTSSFLYFNELDLLAGFMAHIGTEDYKPMEKGNLLSTIFSLMMGEEYTKSVENLKTKIDMLTKQSDDAMKQLGIKLKKANEILTEFESIKQSLSELTEQNKETKKLYEDAKKDNEKILGDIANSKTNIKAQQETIKALNNTLADIENRIKQQAETEGEEGETAEEEPSTPSIVVKSRKGMRAKNDELIIQQIEQEQNNNAKE